MEIEKVNEFIKASSGKSELVTSKCLKKIYTDCNLKKATGMDMNGLDIEFSGAMAKMKLKGGMPAKDFCDCFIPKYLAPAAAKNDKKNKKSVDEIEKDIHEAITDGGAHAHGATKACKAGGVERLTDTSKYTGSHKGRFDEEGKGKGLAGREDKVENTGYVGEYKGENTYDKKK